MEFGRLTAGEAEHHALIARALPALELVQAFPGHSLIDVRRLRVDRV